MRGYVPAYEVKTPKSLAEALETLSAEPGKWRPLAGGTDLMVLLETGTLGDTRLMNLQSLKELHGIDVTSLEVKIRALTTFRQLLDHPVLNEEFPLLTEAARSIGAIAIQNRATIGGNIANASPAADSPPALIAHEAMIELVSKSGIRRLAYSDFHLGYKKTQLKSDELIRAVVLPRKSAARPFSIYRKVGTRKAQAISKICFAGLIDLANPNHIRLAYGSVAPTVLRCKATEAVLNSAPSGLIDRKLIESAKEALAGELNPIDDIRSTAEYRLRVSLNLLEDFLMQVRRQQTPENHNVGLGQ